MSSNHLAEKILVIPREDQSWHHGLGSDGSGWLKGLARDVTKALCCVIALSYGASAAALEQAKYDYVLFGLGWQSLEDEDAAAEGEVYTAQLSWGVAKQAEITARATFGELNDAIDTQEAAVGGQFHYPFGLRTDVTWGAELVSRERDGRGVSDDATLDLFAGFRFWPTQHWEVSGQITFVDTLESGDSAFGLGMYYNLDRSVAVGAQLTENNDAEMANVVVRWSF